MSIPDAKTATELFDEIYAIIPWDYPELDTAVVLRSRIERMEAALRLIAGERCETYFSRPGDPDRYQCADSGRTRDAECLADRWCDACIAHEALS